MGDKNLSLIGEVQVVDGRVGPAVYLDGVNAGIMVNDFSFDGQQLTVEAWVKPDGEQTRWSTILDYWVGNSGFWLGSSNRPGGYEFWIDRSHIPITDGLTEGQWQHVAGVLDGDAGTITLYINGMELNHVEGIDPFSVPSMGELGIGSKGDSSQMFKGIVDEVMIWAEARTAEQICMDAGGIRGADNCNFEDPVGHPPGPCEGVNCSGHGQCEIVNGSPVCICDDGYNAEGLECVHPCTGIDHKIEEWLNWYLPRMEEGLEEEMQNFVNDYQSGNSAWNANAEAWTVASLFGLFYNSKEVFCLGVLKAIEEDPRNPVALANAAACMMELGWGSDGRIFLDCSYHLAPHNAATVAGQAYHEEIFNQDTEKALDKYDEAIEKDPSNPEWVYQALQLALQLNRPDLADDYLSMMPGPSEVSPGGYNGTLPSEDSQRGGSFCCPCDTPTTYETISECTANCSVSLACFSGICFYTGDCQAHQNPFSFQLKLCVPPSGLQVCFTFSTDGTIGVQGGASLYQGFLGAGAGFTYNPINNTLNIVIDAGTSNLPINTGISFSFNPFNGQATGSAGVSDSTGMFTYQTTLLSN